ncbi:MAG: hypothetical protein Q4D89_09900 [Arachnia propionica]|uniref:hypothetical protein n=1 Tax=Arachnia propionica TaxID=1750 RepID=UPI00270A5616|nr:hypothetical protein [Arachnia propionica]
MDKLTVLVDRPVARIGDRLTLDLSNAGQLRSVLTGPQFVALEDDRHRYAAGLEFLGLPCRLFLTTVSLVVSFDGCFDPDSVMSLLQVKRFRRCHPSLPHTVHGLASVGFNCPEGSWRELSFFHDKKQDHTTFRAQL